MKKKSILKRCLTVVLATALYCGCLFGCDRKKEEEKQSMDEQSSIIEQSSESEVSEEVSEVIEPKSVFGEPKSSDTPVTDGEFINVADIDSKYIVQRLNGYTYIDCTAPQFQISGIEHPDNNKNTYYRLDAESVSKYSGYINGLAACTPGVRISFRTNASEIILKATMRSVITGMNHFANRGAYGFDVYTGTGTNRIYCGAMMQNMTSSTAVEEKITLPGGFQEVTIELPLYGGVSKVIIGISNNTKIALPLPYDYTAPVCFYGSSITQGCSVSRPGNSYPNIITRMLNAGCMNLGFSGGAKGEQYVAEYIASRDICAFVMDYDYNADTVADLQSTHYLFYKTVREAHKDIPIIMVTRPYYSTANSDDIARKAVIKASYDKAVADGDTNVYYIDGECFFDTVMRDLYAVDYLHPNDLGQYKMAEAIFPVLKEALKKGE